MISNGMTMLRAVEEADEPLLVELRNDIDIQELLLARARPNSRARVREWVDRLAAGDSSLFFVIAAVEDRSAVGYLQITGIDLINGRGALGIAIHPAFARRGHGRAAIELVCPYLQAVFGLRKLVLDVRADNAAAIALYRTLGFREVGVWTEHHRVGGRYLDVMSMELLLGP